MTFISCSNAGNFTIKLTDAPIDTKLGKTVEQVNVTISEISIRQKGSAENAFTRISVEEKAVNLLNLQNGVTQEILNTELENGDYTELRVVVKEDNTIKFSGDDTLYSLKIPSGTSSGVKIKTDFTISSESKEITLDFDAAESVSAGGSNDYKLSPVIKLK